MRHVVGMFVALMALGSAAVDSAAHGETMPVKDEGVRLIGPEDLIDGSFSAPEDYPAGMTAVEVEGQAFEQAVEVSTGQASVDWWTVQLVINAQEAVSKGDAVEAAFWARAIETKDETGEARFRVLFQGGEPDYVKSVVADFGASRQWKEIRCPFTVVEDAAAGEAMFAFAFPNGPQTVQIAGLTVTNYGDSVSFDHETVSWITYPGQEPDAAWRADAEARIERIRKGDLVVTVRDVEGNPVPGARVRVTMTRHGFPWGTAVSVKDLDGKQIPGAYGEDYEYTESDLEQYYSWLERWFTKAIPETALMPNGWTGVWPRLNREVGIQAVRDYHAMGYTVRGHMLVWPGWQWFGLPGVAEAKHDPEALAKLVVDHVRDETSTLKEWIDEWTLLNEAYAHHDVMDIVGNEAMVDWFNVAHEADPDAKLYINDYGILSGAGLDTAHQDAYAELIQFLLDRGAPLHGIGFQGHFGDDPTPPERVYAILERFAGFGKEMQITEFDINTADNVMQANYTRDFLTICFSHPSIVGISFWGFWESDHWRPKGAMINANWKLKPSGEVFDRLVRETWWTNEEGVTDENGVVRLRGFIGEHRVAVSTAAKTRERAATIGPGEAALEVVLGENAAGGK